MKLTKLLVLSALWLVGLSAQAADLIERKAPAPAFNEEALAAVDKTPAAFAEGTYYLLYNIGAQKFWLPGNNYSTRASIGTWTASEGDKTEYSACVIYFTQTSDAKAKGDNVYELKNWVPKFKEFRSAFGGNTGVGDIWTDNNGRDDRFWIITEAGSNTYRISNQKNETSFYLGWNGSDTDWTLYLLDPATEGAAVDWQLIALPEWATYAPSQELKAAIESAEAAKLDVSAAVTVYNNENATAEQLKEAAAALKETLANNIGNGTAEVPTDASSKINNPNFDNASNDGWEGTKPNMKGDGNHAAANVAEVFNNTFNTYQDVADLPNGVYALTAGTMFRGSIDDYLKGTNQDAYPYLYGVTAADSVATLFKNAWSIENTKSFKEGDKTYFGTPFAEGVAANEGITYYSPNNPSTFRIYYEAGYYKTATVVEVTDGKLRIGVKKDKKASYNGSESGSDWAIFDTFGLTFFGNTAASYKAAYTKYLKDMYEVPVASTDIVSQSVVDALPTAIAAAAANIASFDDVKAAMAAGAPEVAAASVAIPTNKLLWKQWENLLLEAQVMITNESYLEFDEIDPLLDYADPDTDGAEYKAIQEAHNLDNAALQAEIDKLQALMTAVVDASKNAIQPEDDVTYMLKNPSFDDKENGATYGWTGWGKSTNSAMPKTDGLNTSDKYNMTAEAWNSGNFDLYQEVENAPAGVYEIEVQGFYRYGRGDNAWSNYNDQSEEYVKPGGAPAFVYMNDVATPFKNVYYEASLTQDAYVACAELDEHNEPKVSESGRYTFKANSYSVQVIGDENMDVSELKFYPDGMTSAAVAFSAGLYKQSAKSLLAKKGDKLRIGVKGDTRQLGDSWVIFDNFKLTYKGFEVESVKPVLEKAIADAKTNLDKGFGTDLRAELIEKLEAAEALLNSEDGKAIFNAAADLVAVDVAASVALFAELSDAVTSMQDLAAAQTGITDEATIDAAYALGEEIDGLKEANNMTDAQAKEYLEKIEEMNAKLKIPAGMADASDANPVPVTSLITNPKYTDNKDTGWTGGAAVNNHEAEMFNKNFDYYQDLENLMPGTYKVTVQGFYRAGDKVGAIDYNNWLKDPEAYNYALLYAKSGDNTFSAPLKRLCTEAVEMAAGVAIPGGWVATKTDTITWEPDTVVQHFIVPDNMEQAEQAFLKTDSAYNYTGNEVIFTVGEDGKARIGVKKEQKLDWDWTLWTNWTLTYYGANSVLEPSLGVIAATGTRVVKTEYFSLSGSRLKSARGLVIVKQTMNDGSVRVIKKVK